MIWMPNCKSGYRPRTVTSCPLTTLPKTFLSLRKQLTPRMPAVFDGSERNTSPPKFRCTPMTLPDSSMVFPLYLAAAAFSSAFTSAAKASGSSFTTPWSFLSWAKPAPAQATAAAVARAVRIIGASSLHVHELARVQEGPAERLESGVPDHLHSPVPL